MSRYRCNIFYQKLCENLFLVLWLSLCWCERSWKWQ